ncbi:hypothetical protein E4T56_gene19561 [Termitomyces sp. T112]|nr:hypothetical protein E4T56_gene19561 [Termitomyces sp. T112]
MSHKKCSILLEWQAACVAMEQGWDEDWVWGQLGEARKARVLGEGSTGQSAGKVGPLQGGQREGASSAADRGKQRASLLLGAGPSKSLRGHECTLGMGFKFSRACAFDHRGLPLQAGGGSNDGIDSTGGGAPMGKGGLRRGAGGEGGIQAGAEHLGVGGNGASVGEEVEERGMAPEGGSLQAELEEVRRREDWLVNKAALGRTGILRWVWEHQVLLDGASVAFASIQDGLVQVSMDHPPELQQGIVRVGRLLAEHWQHNAVAPRSWWEVAVDVEEALPGLAEVLVVVWAQMEVDLGIGMAGALGGEE